MKPTTDYSGVDDRVCTSCGVRQCGEHNSPADCIRALREVIAILEFRIEGMVEDGAQHGRVTRKNNRFVTVDQKRMCLSDAARYLGISLSTLRKRIARRIGSIDDEVDLRNSCTDREARGRKNA